MDHGLQRCLAETYTINSLVNYIVNSEFLDYNP